MTTPDPRGLGFDPNHGRRVANAFFQELTFRLQTTFKSRPFVAFIAVSALIVGTYYFVIAAPIYVSQASFSIRGRESAPSAMSLLGAATGQPTNSSLEVAEVQEYIKSDDLLRKLDARFHLRKHYSAGRFDLFNHMSSHARREDFLGFYKRMIKVRVEHDSGLLHLEVRSFDPKTAQQVANAILSFTADYVNDISSVMRRDTLRASEEELAKAESAVRDARLAMTRNQINTGMLSPLSTAAARSSSIEAMRQQIIQAQAEMAGMKTYAAPGSPQIRQYEAKITALKAQIAATQQTLTSPKEADTMARRLYEYEGLLVTSEYAEKQLVAALAGYDSARTLANQRERFVVPVTQPNLPDKATLPHRMQAFLQTMAVLIAAYGIIALAIAGIRDHQGI